MRTNAPLSVFPDLPIEDGKPDGIFESIQPGAIFESKLRDPRGHPLFLATIAAYALVAEKAHGYPFDRGILLHCGYRPKIPSAYCVPRRRPPASARCIANLLDRLEEVIAISWRRWQSRRHGRGSGTRPASWAQLLSRPGHAGDAPAPKNRGPCADCDFKTQCFAEEDGGSSIRTPTLHSSARSQATALLVQSPVMDALSKGDDGRGAMQTAARPNGHARAVRCKARNAGTVCCAYPDQAPLHSGLPQGHFDTCPQRIALGDAEGLGPSAIRWSLPRDLPSFIHSTSEPPLAPAEALDRARRRLGRPYFDRLAGYARLMKQCGPPSGR